MQDLTTGGVAMPIYQEVFVAAVVAVLEGLFCLFVFLCLPSAHSFIYCKAVLELV